MSTCIVAVFAAVLEFALVNTLARKEIRNWSIRAKRQAEAGEGSERPSDTVKQTNTLPSV